MTCGDEGGSAALLRLGSKFNHSCSPNAAFSWEPDDTSSSSSSTSGAALFFALRDIEAGEDLTVSYLSDGVLSLDVKERRRRLRQKPGMEGVTCSCTRCAAEEGESSDTAAEPALAIEPEPEPEPELPELSQDQGLKQEQQELLEAMQQRMQREDPGEEEQEQEELLEALRAQRVAAAQQQVQAPPKVDLRFDVGLDDIDD